MINIPIKKLKSGFSLPAYGLGTWQMGGRTEPDRSKDVAELAAIKHAIELGIKYIDTAESYGDGHAEELIGQAIKLFNRSQLTISTKVSAWNQRYADLVSACEGSLARLGTDYIDLYLLHRYPEPGIPIKETMRAMDYLVSEGLVRNIGVCNLTPTRFMEAQRHTAHKLVCNQLHYSLKCREPEARGVVKYCQDNDVLLVAWGPLEKGVLANSGLLYELANKYGKTPYQIALNWLIGKQNVTVISKTTNVEHLRENLGAIGWKLTEEDHEGLLKEFPNQQLVSSRVPLDYKADIGP